MGYILAVPNFSSSNEKIIENIVNIINNSDDTLTLDLNISKSLNRSVITFVSSEAEITEVSYKIFEYVKNTINMEGHKGEHPRMGAIDVFPLVPLKKENMHKAIDLSHKIAKKVSNLLDFSIFCYRESALISERYKLSDIRGRGYENLKNKLLMEENKPDYGPSKFNSKLGATAIGARKVLIAYNVILNSDKVEIAKNIAKKIRSSGYVNDEGNRVHGALDGIEALGFRKNTNDESRSLVSTNIIDYEKFDSLYEVFNAIENETKKYGVTINHSEIIGLVPLSAFNNGSFKTLNYKNLRKTEILNDLWSKMIKIKLNINKKDIKDKILEFNLEDKLGSIDF